MIKTVALEVEAATYDLGQGLANFAGDIAVALKDGFQPADLGLILSAVMLDLVPILNNFKDLPADLKDSPKDFLAAWMTAGLSFWGKLK